MNDKLNVDKSQVQNDEQQDTPESAQHSSDAEQTDFGFERVAWQDKTNKVAAVFHSVAGKYDIMNDLMSFGVHRLWKRCAVDKTAVRPGQTVLDLACGSGDLVKLLAKRVASTGKIIASDINPSMLTRARQCLIDSGLVRNIEFIEANAEHLPFPDNHVDVITMAFGLRNVTDKAKALREMYRVLKPNGRLMVLEFSKVDTGLIKKFYDFYSFKLIPKIGKIVAQDESSYRYLVESIRMHPDQEQLKTMMLAAGFATVNYDNLSHGIVAIHCADKGDKTVTALQQ